MNKEPYFRGDRNNAILKKIKSILEGAEFEKDITIVIEVHSDEMPSIRYNISEVILPDTFTEDYGR